MTEKPQALPLSLRHGFVTVQRDQTSLLTWQSQGRGSLARRFCSSASYCSISFHSPPLLLGISLSPPLTCSLLHFQVPTAVYKAICIQRFAVRKKCWAVPFPLQLSSPKPSQNAWAITGHRTSGSYPILRNLTFRSPSHFHPQPIDIDSRARQCARFAAVVAPATLKQGQLVA